MVPSVLRIGALATQCGVSIDTIRYYERCKLLPRAGRSRGGFRLFAPDAVERIRFIKQETGAGAWLLARGDWCPADAWRRRHLPQRARLVAGQAHRTR